MNPEQRLNDKNIKRNPSWKKAAAIAGIVAASALITSVDLDWHFQPATTDHSDDGFGGIPKLEQLVVGLRPPFTFTEDSFVLFELGSQSGIES